MTEPIDIFHQDFLSDRSYRERQTLLIASAVVLTIVRTGLIPTKISSLGIELTIGDQQAMLRVMAAFIGYLLLSFSIHAWCDYTAHRTIYAMSRRGVLTKHIAEEKTDEEMTDEEYQRALDADKGRRKVQAFYSTLPPKERVLVVTMRRWFDLGAPVLLGIAGICVTLSTPARALLKITS